MGKLREEKKFDNSRHEGKVDLRKSGQSHPKMNGDHESIVFYVQHVFEFHEESRLNFKGDVFPYLQYFMDIEERLAFQEKNDSQKHKCGGYRRIRKIFNTLVAETYGNETIFIEKKTKSYQYRLRKMYQEQENRFVSAWMSPDISTYEEFKQQAIGFGKLAFRRPIWPEVLPKLKCLEYYHTGVTMLRTDQKVDLIEVAKISCTEFKVEIKEANEVIQEQHETNLFIDNRCLQKRGVLNTFHTLFRISRILNRSVSYDLTRFNCDHVATWLLTGIAGWTTANFVVDFPIKFKFKGEIDDKILDEIEEQLEF